MIFAANLKKGGGKVRCPRGLHILVEEGLKKEGGPLSGITQTASWEANGSARVHNGVSEKEKKTDKKSLAYNHNRL